MSPDLRQTSNKHAGPPQGKHPLRAPRGRGNAARTKSRFRLTPTLCTGGCGTSKKGANAGLKGP
eukprot:12650574-Alexandrium_andersonii.AAC.1